jgi:hypothetical protein
MAFDYREKLKTNTGKKIKNKGTDDLRKKQSPTTNVLPPPL